MTLQAYLGFKVHNLRYQPGRNGGGVLDGSGRLVKTSIDPIPIIYPHHYQSTKDRIPQLFPCWSSRILWMLDSCRPRACCPYSVQRMCCSSIGTASGAGCGSLLLEVLIHEDNVGKFRRHLSIDNKTSNTSDIYQVRCWIRLMGIDHQSHVGGVVKMRHLLKGPRSRASELWMTGTTSIEESHR